MPKKKPPGRKKRGGPENIYDRAMKALAAKEGAKGAAADAPDGDEFVLRGTITSQFSAIIDFSPKGGPKNLNARFQLVSGRPIVSFPDGNGWARISDKPAIPAPVDLKREQPMQADKRSGLAKLRGALDTDQLQKDSQAAGFSFPKLPFS